jgi:glutathione S-transferase
MKLYYSPGACSLATHIVAAEAGIELALEKVDTGKHLTSSGADYYGVNSKGQVPFLQLDDGSTLSEGPIIAQYLADKAQARTLMPESGSMARYRVQEWQNFVTSELHKGYTPLFGSKYDDAAKREMTANLRRKYEWLDKQLAGKTFLTGDAFTAADAYLFTVTAWSKYVKLDLSDLPNLMGFMKRAGARPSVAKAMKEEGLPAHA